MNRAGVSRLEEIARLVRYYILLCSTEAGSGHPTSSLSATDLMVALFFNKLRYDLRDPKNLNNDRVIFSKGHVSPLIYSLYTVAGEISEKELLTYRKFKSPLEGHPTPKFTFSDIASGSLGQGLSVGVGMALALRAQISNSPNVYVLMGDSEVAEGSVWEAMEIASYYKLGNLIGIIDVNRLGQSGETMLGWDTDTYKRRVEAFGWEAHVVNGNDMEKVMKVFEVLKVGGNTPKMIIAKTIKGKGVSFLENKEGWHGKALPKEDFEKAVLELGKVDKTIRAEISKPKVKSGNLKGKDTNGKLKVEYKLGEEIATRKAFGEALAKVGELNSRVVVLDAEVRNSTFTEIFEQKLPKRFFEIFIAEQNMVGVATGFSVMGNVPFVSTFAAFFTRAYDQIRMSAYSGANVKYMGSHTGVSIGEDGTSQMGLEDISMFSSIFGSTVLCPADAVSAAKLTELAANTNGIFYIRTARPATKVIYKNSEVFKVGGSKVLRQSKNDKALIVACGVTVFEALKAQQELSSRGINVRVIDAYSIKPIDKAAIVKNAKAAGRVVISVEDHYPVGGLGDAVLNCFSSEKNVLFSKLSVTKLPMSGKGEELMDYEGISSKGIIFEVKGLLSNSSKL